MSYEIIAKFQSDKSPECFIELIQDVYDINGVDGICSVERDESSAFSPANGLIARFHRETEDDWEYVALRACNATTVGGVETVSLLRAAVYASAIAQLRSEITLYDTHAGAMAPMVEALEKGGLSVSINNFDELYQACVDGVKNDFVKFTLDLHKDVPATASADVFAPKRFQRDPRALSGLAKMLSDEGNLAFAPDWGGGFGNTPCRRFRRWSASSPHRRHLAGRADEPIQPRSVRDGGRAHEVSRGTRS